MRKKLVGMEIVLAGRYRNGETASQLAVELRCDKTTVISALRRAGVQVRNGGKPKVNLTDAQRDEVVSRYAAGASRESIKKILGLHSGHAIDRVLKSSGAVIEIRQAQGENHHSWKGGHVDVNGYRHVRLRKSDPFHSMTSNGYMMEHRLVVARDLGRVLERHETVHHKNGDRADNSLDNLQLRQGRHGQGVVYQCKSCGSHDVEAVKLATH